jgi:hypothetical protein
MSINEEIYFSSLKLYIPSVFYRGKHLGFLWEEFGYNFNFFPKNIIPKYKRYPDKTPLLVKRSLIKLNLIEVGFKTFLDIVRHYIPLVKMADKNIRCFITRRITKIYCKE